MTDEQMKELAELRVTIQDLKYQLIRKHDLRELTDEEITEIGLAHGAFFTESKHHLWGDDLEIHDFARAILKRASEK